MMSLAALVALPPSWLARAVESGLERVRANAALNPAAMREAFRERSGGHLVDRSPRPHLLAALDWLARAQDVTREGGFSRGYSLTWNPDLRAMGWQPAHPETTGYIIVVLHQASRHLVRPDLAERALRAARWSLIVQREQGVLRKSALSRPPSPVVFHTGQVVHGWLSAYEETGDGLYASAARRAARYLASSLQSGALHAYGDSRWMDRHEVLRRARAAWVLAAAGQTLREPEFTVAAARHLRQVAAQQCENGWFSQTSGLAERSPLLHTLAGGIRGLLEGGRILDDAQLMDHAAAAARSVAETLSVTGRLPGRFGEGWRSAANWRCPSGEAQMAAVWLRLYELTGESEWREPATVVLRFLKSTQNRTTRNPGLRGGLKGSYPLRESYGRFQTLNWATAYFAEAVLLEEQVETGSAVVEAVCRMLD
jgi:uncharacterized protein YyaL (SSP411 family)